MKPKEQFALALRIIGVLGIAYIVRVAVKTPSPPTYAVIARVAGLLIGVYFLRGASLLVKFAYPDSAVESADKPSA
jgi:sorbitol-specific phosphotransferase system component IIBC